MKSNDCFISRWPGHRIAGPVIVIIDSTLTRLLPGCYKRVPCLEASGRFWRTRTAQVFRRGQIGTPSFYCYAWRWKRVRSVMGTPAVMRGSKAHVTTP